MSKSQFLANKQYKRIIAYQCSGNSSPDCIASSYEIPSSSSNGATEEQQPTTRTFDTNPSTYFTLKIANNTYFTSKNVTYYNGYTIYTNTDTDTSTITYEVSIYGPNTYTFTLLKATTGDISASIIGGGGGGGGGSGGSQDISCGSGGGGGASGEIKEWDEMIYSSTASTYSIVVGAGGTGGVGGASVTSGGANNAGRNGTVGGASSITNGTYVYSSDGGGGDTMDKRRIRLMGGVMAETGVPFQMELYMEVMGVGPMAAKTPAGRDGDIKYQQLHKQTRGRQEDQEDQEEEQAVILIVKVAETEEILATQIAVTAGVAGVVQNGQIQVVMVRAELQHMVVMEEMVVAATLRQDLTGHHQSIMVAVAVAVAVGGLGDRLVRRQVAVAAMGQVAGFN